MTPPGFIVVHDVDLRAYRLPVIGLSYHSSPDYGSAFVARTVVSYGGKSWEVIEEPREVDRLVTAAIDRTKPPSADQMEVGLRRQSVVTAAKGYRDAWKLLHEYADAARNKTGQELNDAIHDIEIQSAFVSASLSALIDAVNGIEEIEKKALSS